MLASAAVRYRLVATLILTFASMSWADPDLRLPPGARKDPESTAYFSGRGLRDATDFLAKELERRGITVEQVGPYRERGVELTRFISRTPSTPWLAVHVLRKDGKTLIFFVPRPAS